MELSDLSFSHDNAKEKERAKEMKRKEKVVL